MKAKRMTLMALLTAVALTIFLVEAQIPLPVPLPGLKLGLSNIITVFAVFLLSGKEAAAILAVRVFLGAVFAGNFSSVFYSAAGGLLAITAMLLLRRVVKQEQMWVASVLGACAHAVGQMAAAVIITGTPAILIYLPALLACSMIAGLFTGLCAQVLVKRGNKLWKTCLQ